MEQLVKTGFNYCPFCGNKLFWEQGPVRFCPACGKKLFADEPAKQDIIPVQKFVPRMEQVKTIEDVIHCHEQFIKDKRLEGWPEDKIHVQAAELAAKLKQKINIKLNKFSHTGVPQPGRQAVDGDIYYSMILKDCPIKENLVRHLENLMVRGYFAIRMAIDRVPSVIIYKSNMDNIVQMIRAFRQEQAAVSVIGGDFSVEVDIDGLFAEFFAAMPDTRTAISSVPAKLWLGDRIIMVTHVVHNRYGKGVMVISNQAVYFLYPGSNSIYSWEVIPYYRLKKIKTDKDGLTGSLEFCYRDIEDKVTFILETAEISHVYKTIQAAMEERQYQSYIKRTCLACQESAVEEVDAAYEGVFCEHCGQILVRTLVQHGA